MDRVFPVPLRIVVGTCKGIFHAVSEQLVLRYLNLSAMNVRTFS